MKRFPVHLAFSLCLVIASSPLFAITRTWTGALNGNWSVAANWSPSGTPDPADDLFFPLNAANHTMTNDLPAGTVVGAMTFGSAYTLNGNLLTLTGDVSGFVSNADLRIGASLSFSGETDGALDINGQTLTVPNASLKGSINGNGTIVAQGDMIAIFLRGSGNFSGTIQQGASGGGVLLGEAVLPNATVSVQQVYQVLSDATLGDVTITPSQSGYVTSGLGILHTKSLTLSHTDGWLGGGLLAVVNPAVNSQIDVTGTVALNGAPLRTYASGKIAAGQTFTIINNDGVDPVNGTFENLPEGAVLDGVEFRFRISYIGGDGNDVVLTTLVDTSTVISQSIADTQLSTPVTLTATVTAQSGSPNGSVVFKADGVPIGPVPLQNGIAELTVTTLAAGTHNIVAAFVGTGPFADSVSAGLTHVVLRRQTQSVIYAHDSIAHYGQEITFTLVISSLPLASAKPTGKVTFRADGVWLGIVTVVNETATFSTAGLHAGVKSITASYSGDANFEASEGSIQQNIRKAPTAVDVRSRPLFLGEIPFLTVFLSTFTDSMIVHGDVTISEDGAVLGAQSDIWGVTTLILTPLALGDHTIVVNYSGDTDFEASSTTIVQNVVAPALSIHGARVNEGKGLTTVSLIVSLSTPVSQPVSVSFATLAGTATEGEDYEKARGVIEFAPGEVSRSIELHIIDDTLPEPDETFSVFLSDPVNATIDVPSAVVVIANDDQVPPRRRPSRH